VPTWVWSSFLVTPSRFTKTSLAALLPRASTYIEYDAELPGFGIRVTPNGAKSFVVDYRANGGGRGAPTRRYTIGNSTTFSADAARKAARDVLARVRLGADPAKEKALDRKAVTIADIERAFMEEEIRPTSKPRTTALYAMYFRLHVLPELGSKRAFEVSHNDIVRLHRKIGLRAKPTANRVASLISAMFTLGCKNEKNSHRNQPRARRTALSGTASREVSDH
jgi:hypothetical protein